MVISNASASVGDGRSQVVYMVGPFPPPVHGMAAMNAAMASALEAAGRTVKKINTSASTLDRGWRRYGRAMRVGRGVMKALWLQWLHPGGHFYMSLSGGYGVVYEAIFAGFARISQSPLTVHHHCFSYIDERFWPMRLFMIATPPHTRHVVLCSRMGYRFRQRYRRAHVLTVLGNAALMQRAAVRPPAITRTKCRKVGFLSNLAPEKGVFDVLLCAERCYKEGLDLSFIIAGPFQDEAIAEAVQARLKHCSNVEYRGPVYGVEKAKFWSEVDVFLFPTQYRNEAEPLVILEALASGSPVIAYERGCIGSQLTPECGWTIDRQKPFVDEAIVHLKTLVADSTDFVAMSAAAVKRSEQLTTTYAASLDQLTKAI